MSGLPPGLVGVPCVEWMWTQAAAGLMEIQRTLPAGSGIDMRPWQSTIAAKRNGLVETLLDSPELRWLFFLDSDMLAPPDTIRRLWSLGSDLAAGLYVQRFGDHEICAWQTARRGTPSDPKRPVTSDPDNLTAVLDPEKVRRMGPFPVHAAGTGCLLVRRRVFESLDPPWFCAEETGISEDVNFTRRCTDAGFSLILDPRVRVGHFGPRAFTLEDSRPLPSEKGDA